MVKEIIKNRKGEKIMVLIEKSNENKGLAFVMHGFGYNKEEPCVATTAESFKQKGYTVIRFDTTNTFGESDGNFENANITNYYEDLEDVINWAKTCDWYQEPFVMAGHSVGGLCILLFAEKSSEKVKAIAPISTIISGKLALEVYPSEIIEQCKKDGAYELKTPEKTIKIKWVFIEDMLKYDSLKNIEKIKMPVLMISGENDPESTVKHQKILYDKIPGKKELKIIKGAGHRFTENNHLEEIKKIFDKWIKTLN